MADKAPRDRIYQDIKKAPDNVMSYRCRTDYFFFLQELWHEISTEKPVWNWHIEYICNELQAVAERVIRREDNPFEVITNVPPGSTKSITCTIAFPAWCWIAQVEHNGKILYGRDLQFITASYSGDLSLEHSSISRDLIKSDTYKHYFPEMSVRADADAKGRFKNEYGGVRHTTSVGGTVTGMHGHILIIDDPIDPEGAKSEAERKTALYWMSQTLPTRKVDKAVTSTFLIQQRLHLEDPTGKWLSTKGKRVHHICLPGEDSYEIKPESARKFYKDGLLDPKRLSRSILESLRIDLGAYGYAGQIGQNPVPDEGLFFPKDWFIDAGNHLALMNEHRIVQIYAAMDFALGEKKENDSNSIKVAAILPDQRYLLIDSYNFKGDADSFKVSQVIIDVHKQWHPLLWGFEEGKERKGIWAYLMSQIKKERLGDFNYELLVPIQDKRARARTLQGQMRQGLWLFPMQAPWMKDVQDQMVGFGVHPHDDEVDSMAWLARLIEESGALTDNEDVEACLMG